MLAEFAERGGSNVGTDGFPGMHENIKEDSKGMRKTGANVSELLTLPNTRL